MSRTDPTPDRLQFDFLVLDLDGTLVDSLQDLCDSANQLVSEHGGALLEPDQVARMVGNGVAVLVERVIAASGIVVDHAAALARYVEIYDGRLLRNTRPYSGIPEFVQDAVKLMPLAVLTNKPKRAAVPVLEGLGLARFFREIVGGDGPHSKKPDPTRLLGMIAAAGAAPERTLYVGDSGVDLRTARNAGTRFCYARYGFGRLLFPEHEIGPSDWVVNSAFELPAVVRGSRRCGFEE
jgi:phosphoglycolate phosphatase